MNVFVPHYYHKFKCIAEKCNHSCCIGWEIEVDAESLKRYEQMEWVLDRISQDTSPHFRLDEHDRCPFLTENGLCEMILTLGEHALCEICSDHPRFRNFYAGFTEMGLGLCCEEAARIILTEPAPFALVPLGMGEITLDADEAETLKIREQVFEALYCEGMSVKEKFCAIAEQFGVSLSQEVWEGLLCVFDEMERFDETWGACLARLKGCTVDWSLFENESFATAYPNLAAYFIFRHFGDAAYYDDARARVAFALVSCMMIGMLGGNSMEAFLETARRYSVEIEYSEENTNRVLDYFKTQENQDQNR